MADYSWRDGQRVAPGTLAAYDAMRVDFERAFPGLTLKISSATRTRAEQEAIFRARYVPATQVRGRRVYDYRWWNGVLWARISAAGTVAVPGTSNHENDRALDIRDTGTNAGVTVAGNARSNWIRANAHRYGFNPNGYSFGEPWHIEYTGNPWSIPSWAGGGATTIPDSQSPNEKEFEMKGLQYVRGADKTRVFMLFNDESGFYSEHSGVDAAYNNALAQMWKTGSWPTVTESHATVLKRNLDKIAS